MAGISAIGMIGYMNRMSAAFQGQPLTAATKAKLQALGVDTSAIKTEAEGRIKLQEAQIAKASGSEKTNKSSKKTSNDDLMKTVKKLADDMNVSYSDNDKVEDIINRIATKVEELLSAAGDDNSKKSEAIDFGGRLNEVKRMQQSQIDLSASMNLSATMNIAFHGLY